MLQNISDRLPPQPFQRSRGNTDDIKDAEDKDQGGNEARLSAQIRADQHEDGSRSLPDTSESDHQRKVPHTPAPKFSGKADIYTSWCRSFLSYANFHSFIGCLTGHLDIDFSRLKLESQAVAAALTARQFEDSNTAGLASRTCCVDPVCHSICKRHQSIHELRSALDGEYRSQHHTTCRCE